MKNGKESQFSAAASNSKKAGEDLGTCLLKLSVLIVMVACLAFHYFRGFY